MKVRISAAGFSAGAASIKASDGPSRAERSYRPVKIGAAQQEQSISGAPASPAIACDRSECLPNKLCSHLGDTNVLTAALIRMPKSNAGQITRKYFSVRVTPPAPEAPTRGTISPRGVTPPVAETF